MTERRRRRIALLPLLSVMVAFGCSEPSTATVDNPDPPLVVGAPADAPPPDDGSVLAATGEPKLEPAIEAEPAKPQLLIPDEPYRVLILGDSLAATGFGVLLEKKLDDHPHVEAYREAKSATGLARPDYFDWYDRGPAQVEFRKPDLIIVVMGGNDGQDIPGWKGSDRVRWDTDGWPAAYRGRVDQFLQELTAPVAREDGSEVSARILWLGLPQMGLRSLEKKLVLIRSIHQEAVASHGQGAVYLDTTPFLVGDDGTLIVKAEVDGKQRELRADDGIHFTMPGSEYLADKVYPGVLDALALPDIADLPKPAEPEPAKAEPEPAKAQPKG